MSRVVVTGGVSRDHLVTVGSAPAYDHPGGPGVYASLAARAAAPVDVTLHAVLPESDTDVRALLDGADVDLSGCVDGPPVPLLWILDSPQGRRVVRTSVPGTHELDETDGPGTPGPDHDTSPRADVAVDPTADVLLRCAPTTGADPALLPPTVLVDLDQTTLAAHGWAHVDDLAPSTTVYLPSRVQLTQLGSDPVATAHALRHRTGRSVVARLDADGALVLPATGGAWTVTSDDVTVVDTTGAGDSHAGALAAALAVADDPTTPGALLHAAAVATAVVSRTLGAVGTAGLVGGHLPTVEDLARVRTAPASAPTDPTDRPTIDRTSPERPS